MALNLLWGGRCASVWHSAVEAASFDIDLSPFVGHPTELLSGKHIARKPCVGSRHLARVLCVDSKNRSIGRHLLEEPQNLQKNSRRVMFLGRALQCFCKHCSSSSRCGCPQKGIMHHVTMLMFGLWLCSGNTCRLATCRGLIL